MVSLTVSRNVLASAAVAAAVDGVAPLQASEKARAIAIDRREGVRIRGR
jgi:hypothetical protein